MGSQIERHRKIERHFTEEQRKKWNEYTREYRRTHPERVKQWRENSIRKAYARLQDQANKEGGAAE